jgi:hypothetical protein
MTAQVPVVMMSIKTVSVRKSRGKIGKVDELTVLPFTFLLHSVCYLIIIICSGEIY